MCTGGIFLPKMRCGGKVDHLELFGFGEKEKTSHEKGWDNVNQSRLESSAMLVLIG